MAGRIANREWKAGSIVPNEAQLSAELNVSQGTVRKALDLLEAEKIVVRKQGRGTFVIDHDTEEMAIRFSSIFNEIGQKIDGHVTCEQSAIGTPTEEERSHLDVVAADVVVRSKRTHSYRERPFMVEKAVLAARHFAGIDPGGLTYNRLTSLAQKHGVHLAYATEVVTPVLCPEELAAKLGAMTGTPILHVERTVYTDRNVRVEWREGWCYLKDKHYMSVTS